VTDDNNIQGDAPTKASIVLGGGCFWCLEAAYKLINGVLSVVSGSAGGAADTAQYETIAAGDTGHAEVVQVSFDPATITLDDILDIFWTIHNPTTLNRQGDDIGPQYRSVIFYTDLGQRLAAEASIKKVQALWDGPVITEVVPLQQFYPAEDYLQNYYDSYPEEAYCQVVINPKLTKLREKFAARLKPEASTTEQNSL
jgi:peptide-methionine (S)-S-oxide reductase